MVPSLTRTFKFTSLRGFKPRHKPTSARDALALWTARQPRPFWLYTHIPFCPQICSFCQCSTSRLRGESQLETYLKWLEQQVRFFAPALKGSQAAFQYLGGGTPNILSDSQLEGLFTVLSESFQFAPDARRTFEFLPSSLRPGTLEVARRFGFSRLSCGVQSQQTSTLIGVKRSTDRLSDLGAMLQHAFGLGYDEINLDLIAGLPGESKDVVVDSLLRTLASKPTTVTIHKMIPIPGSPTPISPEEEVERHRDYLDFAASLGAVLERHAPDYTVVRRASSVAVVRKEFHASPKFSLYYYSDNERIHIDTLGLGRHSASWILGKCFYNCISYATDHDPDEKSFTLFEFNPVVDATLDAISDLVTDRETDLAVIEDRFGSGSTATLLAALPKLESQGIVRRDGSRWRFLLDEYVYIDSLLPLLSAASVPFGPAPTNAVTVPIGGGSVQVVVERAHPTTRYFKTIGHLGIYYRPEPGQPAPSGSDVSSALGPIADDIAHLLTTEGEIEPRYVLDYLRAERGGA